MSLEEDILSALRKIKNKEVKPVQDIGLCYLLHILTDYSAYRISTQIEKHFLTWEHYSGNTTFPVPSTDKRYSTQMYYVKNTSLWRGKQGKLRQSLVDHLINCLEKGCEKAITT